MCTQIRRKMLSAIFLTQKSCSCLKYKISFVAIILKRFNTQTAAFGKKFSPQEISGWNSEMRRPTLRETGLAGSSRLKIGPKVPWKPNFGKKMRVRTDFGRVCAPQRFPFKNISLKIPTKEDILINSRLSFPWVVRTLCLALHEEHRQQIFNLFKKKREKGDGHLGKRFYPLSEKQISNNFCFCVCVAKKNNLV